MKDPTPNAAGGFFLLLSSFAALAASAAGLPPDAVEKLKDSLPVEFYGMPSARTTKVNPIVSDTQRRVDRRVVVDVKAAPFALVGFSDDAKCVEVAYLAGEDAGSATNSWFKTDDVLSLGKIALAEAEAGEDMLLYSPWGDRHPALVGYAAKGTAYIDFGVRRVGREVFRLVLVKDKGERSVAGRKVAGRLLYARERAPAVDAASYARRVAELVAEEPYAHGAPWAPDHRPLIVDNPNMGCVALVTDFARYVFGAENFNTGERFEDASEIRAGDVISISGHFFAVMDRSGDKLVTIEGNFNKAICQTDANYAISKKGFVRQGKLAPNEFICGYHYLKEAPKKPIGVRFDKGGKKKKK